MLYVDQQGFDIFRYLQQFQDLYTEEGRKPVKICSYVPTQLQAMIQAQKTNQVKSEPTGTPSPCQGQKTDNKTPTTTTLTTTANANTVKSQGHPNSGNKMVVNTVVKNDGSNVPSQSVSGKVPIYNTASLAGSPSGLVMTGNNSNLAGMTVQGKTVIRKVLRSANFNCCAK